MLLVQWSVYTERTGCDSNSHSKVLPMCTIVFLCKSLGLFPLSERNSHSHVSKMDAEQSIILTNSYMYGQKVPSYPTKCYKEGLAVKRRLVSSFEEFLFGMRSQVHASTGYSPMHMLYNKDPVMPFKVANKLKDCDGLSSIPSSSSSIDKTDEVTSPGNGELIDTVQQLEEQRHEIFGNAKQKFRNPKNIMLRGLIIDKTTVNPLMSVPKC